MEVECNEIYKFDEEHPSNHQWQSNCDNNQQEKS
jgi:hypothetical protein